MSDYQFNTNNSNKQEEEKKSFFADEKAVDAEKDYQKMRLNTPIDPDYRIFNASAPVKKRMTADDLINQVMSITPAKPVYDAQRPEEIKRLMKANALSEAFRTMGETFSLAKGGTVNRREPNTKNSQYQNALWNTIDNYNQKTDAWNNQEYMRKMQKGLAQVGQINKDRAFSSDLAKQKYNMAKDNRNYQLDKDKFGADKDYKKWLKDKELDDDAESKRKWEAEFGLKQETERDKKNKRIQTSQKTYDLTPEEASYYRGEAVKKISEIQKLHPDWIVKVPEIIDGYETGNFNYRLSSYVKDDDLIRSYLEMKDKAGNKPVPGIDTAERPYFGYPSSGDQGNKQFTMPGLGSRTNTPANNSSFKLPGL